MLAFERQVTRALLTDPDAEVRARAEAFVDSSLRAMPEHLRAGVLLESVALSTATALLRSLTGKTPEAAVTAVLESLSHSRVSVLRQYPRLFRSLTVFAECEAATDAVQV